MIKFLFSVILLLIASTSFAQKDSVRKYLDENLHFTTKKDFAYAAMAIKDNDHWLLYAVYPDATPVLQVYYRDAGLVVKDGPFSLYYPKRVPAQKGYFKNNLPNGHWQTWYPSGNQKNEGFLVNNHFSAQWKEWYENGKPASEKTYTVPDSTTGTGQHQSFPSYKVQAVLDDFNPEGKLEGACTTWYENGNKESVVNYHNDSLAGVCSWYRENGNPSSKETYVNGKVSELECYDENGKYSGATCSILKLPVLIHPMFSALDYIEYELHKEKNRDIRDEGEVSLSFTVTKKGEVKNLLFLNSPDPALNKHITQIFATMPGWSPAITHNRAVDYSVKLVVPYYRE